VCVAVLALAGAHVKAAQKGGGLNILVAGTATQACALLAASWTSYQMPVWAYEEQDIRRLASKWAAAHLRRERVGRGPSLSLQSWPSCAREASRLPHRYCHAVSAGHSTPGSSWNVARTFHTECRWAEAKPTTLRLTKHGTRTPARPGARAGLGAAEPSTQGSLTWLLLRL
jgi:hypothetical protein